MKALFVHTGESFRTGGQYSRLRGQPESLESQKAASSSHIDLYVFLKEKYNISCDIAISTYTTPYDGELKSWYKEGIKKIDSNSKLIFFETLENLIGHAGHMFHNTINKINVSDYDFIFFIRIDACLKEYFKKKFDPYSKKILFSSISWHHMRTHAGVVACADLMYFIPKHLYQYIPHLFGHEAYRQALQAGISPKDIGCILDSLHDADSYKDWNPLYYITGRPETQDWASPGWTYVNENGEMAFNQDNPKKIKEDFI